MEIDFKRKQKINLPWIKLFFTDLFKIIFSCKMFVLISFKKDKRIYKRQIGISGRYESCRQATHGTLVDLYAYLLALTT